jgi:hypothetical protein
MRPQPAARGVRIPAAQRYLCVSAQTRRIFKVVLRTDRATIHAPDKAYPVFRRAHTMTPLPPASEIFSLKAMAERNPTLLPENRLRWMARNRARNGLEAAGAIYDSPAGELLFHEPTTIAWLSGLTGRAKPRSKRRAARPARGHPGARRAGDAGIDATSSLRLR